MPASTMIISPSQRMPIQFIPNSPMPPSGIISTFPTNTSSTKVHWNGSTNTGPRCVDLLETRHDLLQPRFCRSQALGQAFPLVLRVVFGSACEIQHTFGSGDAL